MNSDSPASFHTRRTETKVLFLISRFLDGGIDTVLVEYLHALAARPGYEVTLCINICMGRHEVFRARLPKQLKVVYLVENKVLTYYKRRKYVHGSCWAGVADELLCNPVRRIIARQKLRALAPRFDVIVDFDCSHGALLRYIDGPRMISFYHFSLHAEQLRDHRHLQRQISRMGIYHRVVLLSEAMLNEARIMMPQLQDRFCRIYNPVDIEKVTSLAGQEVADTRINQPFMLAVSRLEERQKDLTTLIQAYSLLRGSDIPKLYILGEGRSRPALQALIDSLNLHNDVVLLGFSTNPYPWMARAKLLLLSSHFEGLPTVLIEGLMLGKLMVATDCPTGPAEILDHGRAGMLVPMRQPQMLSEAILQTLSNCMLQTRLKANIAKHRALFAPAQCAEQLCALF